MFTWNELRYVKWAEYKSCTRSCRINEQRYVKIGWVTSLKIRFMPALSIIMSLTDK